MFKDFKSYVAISYKNFTCYSSFRQVLLNYTRIQLNKLNIFKQKLYSLS